MTTPSTETRRGRRPAPRPEPLSAEERARADATARRLQEELRALFSHLPPEDRGASALARRLSIDRATCQRAVAASEAGAADAALLTRAPGVQGLRRLVDALAADDVDRTAIDEAHAAIDRFAELLRGVGGSQSRLRRRLEASSVGARPASPSTRGTRSREKLFEAARDLTGHACDVTVSAFFYRPVPDQPDRIESALVSGFIGLVSRPDAVPLIVQTELRSGGTRRADAFEALDASPAKGRSPSAVLSEFSSEPLPLVTSSGPDGLLVQSIDPAAAARGPVDVVIARRPGSSSPHPATEDPPVHEVLAVQHVPTRHLVFDVVLHRDLAMESVPSAEIHLVKPGFEEQIAHRWMTRLPEAPRLEVLPRGLREPRPAAWQPMGALLRRVLEGLGWPADEMLAYRLEESHPIWRAGYLVRLDFSRR